MKKCPYCAEEIQDEATKCRFCGEVLNKKKIWKGCLWGCLIALIIYILLSIGFLYFLFYFPGLILNKMFFWFFPSPHHQPAPSGIEDFFRSFAEAFRAFWGWIKDFLHIAPQIHQVNF